jgi:hypothetical protein
MLSSCESRSLMLRHHQTTIFIFEVCLCVIFNDIMIYINKMMRNRESTNRNFIVILPRTNTLRSKTLRIMYSVQAIVTLNSCETDITYVLCMYLSVGVWCTFLFMDIPVLRMLIFALIMDNSTRSYGTK